MSQSTMHFVPTLRLPGRTDWSAMMSQRILSVSKRSVNIDSVSGWLDAFSASGSCLEPQASSLHNGVAP